MPRRHQSEERDNHERWIVSYADFVTLLFAFFVVMYAISSVSEGKYRVLSNSLVQAFRNVTVNAQGVQVMVPASAATLPQNVTVRREARTEEQRRVTRERMRNMARDLSEVLAPLVREGTVRVTQTARGVTVEINASVLFAPGDASLEHGAARALRAVAGVLALTDYPVTVEGHTDDTPIATLQFPSNWELSVVRASRVVRLLVEAGVSARRLTATGFGEQRPVTANTTPEGRARNRRVMVLIDSPSTDVPEELPVAQRAVNVGRPQPQAAEAG
jgi:chemotaxis protein MotB